MGQMFALILFICLQYTEILCLPLSSFYPLNDGSDIKLSKGDDINSKRVQLLTQFPFLGVKHKSVIVSTDGGIFFDKIKDEFDENPLPWVNFSAVLPFWSDVDTSKGGSVSYQQSNSSDRLTRASRDITRMFSLRPAFVPKLVFTATWLNVRFFGAKKAGLQRSNTYQAVMVTDGTASYVIFNYNSLQWLAGVGNGGHVNTGMGGKSAQVGFNAGDGKIYHAVKDSGTPKILTLTQNSNVNSSGQFAFRVDNKVIDECLTSPCIHGKCSKETNGYRCTCDDGYEGRNCQTNINDCASSPCNNGTCLDLVGDFKCKCHSGYTGRNCSLESVGCRVHRCENGDCLSSTGGYACVCHSGYIGFHCNIALSNIYIGVGTSIGILLLLGIIVVKLYKRNKDEQEPLISKKDP